MSNDLVRLAFMTTPEHRDWLKTQADDVGVPLATYLRMHVKQLRDGIVPAYRVPVARPAAAHEPAPVYEPEADDVYHEDGEAGVDADAILARAEQRIGEYVPDEPQVSAHSGSAVLRVGGGRAAGPGNNPYLPAPVGRHRA